MPISLIKWLLEKEKIELINKKYNNDILVIMKDEEELLFILNHLIKYVDNSKYWIKITAAIKNLLNKYNNFTEIQLLNIWNDWSKNGNKYDKVNNKIIWNSITMNINFNYFVEKCNKTLDKKDKINLFKTIKDYIPIINDISTYLIK